MSFLYIYTQKLHESPIKIVSCEKVTRKTSDRRDAANQFAHESETERVREKERATGSKGERYSADAESRARRSHRLLPIQTERNVTVRVRLLARFCYLPQSFLKWKMFE